MAIALNSLLLKGKINLIEKEDIYYYYLFLYYYLHFYIL